MYGGLNFNFEINCIQFDDFDNLDAESIKVIHNQIITELKKLNAVGNHIEMLQLYYRNKLRDIGDVIVSNSTGC